MSKQLMLFSDEDLGEPIPECSARALEIYKTPENVARLTLDAARKWKRQHPKQNVMEIIPPTWREYVKANI